jgi:O-antigen/teichoic acid export membrane protein
MSTIRKQSIISSAIVYFGFALGALNIYLFARGFEPAHFGLTTLFVSIANIMYAFANVGMESYIYKFYPYYKDNLRPEENDMMSWALLIGIAGFTGVVAAGLAGKQWMIRNFGENSADLVTYYYWIFPFGFGLTLYSLLEAFSLHLNKTILTTFLREVLFRLFTTILIALSITGLLTNFDIFIKIYSFTYLLLALILLVYLGRAGKLHFSLTPSRVTRKFFRKIRTMVAFTWGAKLVFIVSTFFALIVIAWVVPKGLESAAVYAIAAYAGSIMQAPQRTLISASIGPLSRAWKDKDLGRINRIYHRSSINQLIFSVGIFVLIWINFTDGINAFHLNPTYLRGLPIFLFIGLTRIVDMGTGVNSQIIGTSNRWRFELSSGLILLLLTIPLNYWMARKYGVIGPAIADLFTFAVYNGMRCVFLYKVFGMQPFTIKSLYTLVLGLAGYFICYGLFGNYHGLGWIVLRSLAFCLVYASGILGLRLSEDVLPVWATIKKRISRQLSPRIRE